MQTRNAILLAVDSSEEQFYSAEEYFSSDEVDDSLSELNNFSSEDHLRQMQRLVDIFQTLDTVYNDKS